MKVQHEMQRFTGSPPAIRWEDGDLIFITLSGNTTIPAPQAPQDGRELTFIFTGTGTAIWSSVFSGLVGPTLSGSGTAAVRVVYDDPPGFWRPVVSLNPS